MIQPAPDGHVRELLSFVEVRLIQEALDAAVAGRAMKVTRRDDYEDLNIVSLRFDRLRAQIEEAEAQ